MTATVSLRRGGRWLLTVRGADVDDAAGQLGLVGGHVEEPADGTGVLEETARREAAEEVGLDLAGVDLLYLESVFFSTDLGEGQVSVGFVAHAPDGAEPRPADATEVADVGWWSADEAARDPRCPDWLPDLLRRADARLDEALPRDVDGGAPPEGTRR